MVNDEIKDLKTQAYDISREIQRLSAILQQVNNTIAQKEYELENVKNVAAPAKLSDVSKNIAAPAGGSLDN